MRSATSTLLLLAGLALGSGACGTILGAEDEYVVGAPAGTGGAGGGLGGSAPTAGASGSGARAGAGGTSTSGGNAGQAGASSGQGGAAAGQSGQGGQGGPSASGAGGGTAGFGGTTTTGGFGGAIVAGSGGVSASGAGGMGTAGSGGANGGSSQGGGNGGSPQGGNAGTSQGGAAGTTSAGAGGSTAGAAGGAGKSGAGAGGSAGATGGSGGAGGAADPCCLAELAVLLTGLEAQYKNGNLGSSGFSYTPPSNSACYTYADPAENTSATIRFAAQSKLPSCSSVAAQVSGISGKGGGLKDAASGVCSTANSMTSTVNAAVAFCSAANKIVCNTTVVQGPDAITAAACTDATCTACATAGTASIKSWLKAQDDYYTANAKFDVAMATPADTACYDYTFVYKDPNVVKLAALAKNTACLSFAGRTDGKPATAVPAAPLVLTSGVCSMPTGNAFSALLVDTYGVIGDCERVNKGPATIACEQGATPVSGTGAVARSACGPE